MVKSQIHAGGRGKGRFREDPELGGVNVVLDGLEGGVEATKRKVGELAGRMLGSTLVTVQTGPEGKQVNRLYIEQGIDIERELYLSIVLDRAPSKNIVMASTEGGTEIEKLRRRRRSKILKAEIDPGLGLLDFQARELAYGLGLAGRCRQERGPVHQGACRGRRRTRHRSHRDQSAGGDHRRCGDGTRRQDEL